MTAVIPSAQSFAGNSRTRTAAAAQRLAEPPLLSAQAQRLDQLSRDQFEKQAKELSAPTLVRPALITPDEVEKLRLYKTGDGQLDALKKITNKRLDFWTESRGGGAPFDVMTPESRALAAKFFEEHGTRLADQPRVAPPNPLKPKPGAETLIEKSKVDLTQPTPAATNAALDKAIVDAERPADQRPGLATPARLNDAPGLLLPPPATLTIEFVSSHGFHCELTLHAPSGTAVLEQGKSAMAKLVEQQARPAPAPVAAAAAPTGTSTASAPPTCKYHGAMKPSKKPGTWFCPKKMASGEYCDQKFEEAA